MAGSAALLLAACQTPKVKLTPAQERLRDEIRLNDPFRDPLPARTEILDVHTHTFNARYLPLRGILLGKRDAAAPLTWFITDRCATLIAEVFINHTELAPVGGRGGAARKMGTEWARTSGKAGPLCKVLLKIIDKAIARNVWERGVSPGKKLERVDALAEDMTLMERIALRTTAKMMGMDEHIQTDQPGGAIRSITRFLWLITQNDAQMPELFREFHEGAPMKGKLKLVTHMMDLGPVYGQPAEGTVLLDFPTEQLRRMERYQRADPGQKYFIAYNPYRDYLPGGQPGDSLRVVKDAIRKRHAHGVKVYPPSGYRAAGNQVKDRPTAWFTTFPGRQYDARYGGLNGDKNAELNRRLDELFAWCEKEDVPVFTHSGHGEFEARKGYGEYHAHPKFWREVLQAHPKLRLCLGHAGGGDFWFGIGHLPDWGQEAYELCTRYPNVYCEVTTGDEMLDEDRRAFFVDRIATLIAHSREEAQRTGNAKVPGERRYDFSKKLLYGTDWFLPDAGYPRDVLVATQTAFLHPRLRASYADYFAGNAKRYLKSR